MYLVDFQLKELCEMHGLVTPFDPARINPASIDLTLGRDFVNLSDRHVDYMLGELGLCALPGQRFEADVVRLVPGVALLATTAEAVHIPDEPILITSPALYPDGSGFVRSEGWRYPMPACVAELRLKSSAARNGLDHALAGWIDPGFHGTLTCEFHAHRSIELIAGKCYMQLVVAATLATPTKGYQQTGRYVGEWAKGAVLARSDKT